MGQDKPDPYGLVRVGGQESSTRWHFGQTLLALWSNLWLGRFLIYDLFSVAKNTQQHTWNAWHSFLMEEVGVLLFSYCLSLSRATQIHLLS